MIKLVHNRGTVHAKNYRKRRRAAKVTCAAAYQVLCFPAGSGNFSLTILGENAAAVVHSHSILFTTDQDPIDLRLTWEKQACQQEPGRKTVNVFFPI